MLKRVEECIGKIETCTDPVARDNARELVSALLDFHGAALAKIFQTINNSASDHQMLISAIAQDEQVSQMLLLHGLHPEDTRTRVLKALEKVRPYLHSHGGNVDLIDVDDIRVRLQLQGSCHGCPSSSMTLKNTIEEAILQVAPDLAIEVV